jgi:hypothetical protein
MLNNGKNFVLTNRRILSTKRIAKKRKDEKLKAKYTRAILVSFEADKRAVRRDEKGNRRPCCS